MKSNKQKIEPEDYRIVDPEKIGRIVERVMKNKVTNNPFDYFFRGNVNPYPQSNHDLLESPGKFKNKENTGTFVKGKGSMEMDFLEYVLQESKMIKRESAINLEQETGEINDSKSEAIFDYCLSVTIALKKPCYPLVATNLEYQDESFVREVEDLLLKIYLIIFDEEKIYQILNALIEKNYHKNAFDEKDCLLFIYCLVFAKEPYALDVTEKLAILFQSINDISLDYQIELYLALCMIIKYHFKGDNNKIMELLIMITEVMPEEVIDVLPFYDRKNLELVELTKKYFESEKQRLDMEKKLSEKDEVISDKNKLIQKLQKELEEYKNRG